MNVFPDPSDGVFRYSIGGLGEGEGEVEVLDLTGRVLEHRQVNCRKGAIDLSDQDAGVYFVRLRGPMDVFAKRIVKID